MNQSEQNLTDDLPVQLARARVQGHTISAPAPIPSLQDAYVLQESVAGLLASPTCGWKVGSTSAEAQARLGTDEPGAGRLLARFVYGDGDTIVVHAAHDLQIEVEFALRVAKDIIPRETPYAAAEVLAHLDAVLPALELVGSRFSAGLAGAGRSLVTADGGANIAFANGAPSLLSGTGSLAEMSCQLIHNGTVAASGTGARALGDPLNVMVWLANHLSARGITLKAGELVSTGTCTGLIPIAIGDELTGDFGPLGRVTVQLTGA